jgi:hypothetical protein
MSEWTTFMKVGITDLVLRMVEANTGDARPHPREPDPRDPRDQPRRGLHAQGQARERARAHRHRDPDRVLREDGAVRRTPRRRRGVQAAPRGVAVGAGGPVRRAIPSAWPARWTG